MQKSVEIRLKKIVDFYIKNISILIMMINYRTSQNAFHYIL
jgi:hypothetical protein